ncbi:hypothetical protein [Janthinobacterium lividum]|uniref:hypothetical protein n=1 Tax=Janthinobacterium lividum TaxID=29581 RepID=UPI000447505B|nr:hypothetical protein [Janthinobacterium lividum]EZP42017.1 hypothetical protein BW37_00797 [Janthinobacterium lividum]
MSQFVDRKVAFLPLPLAEGYSPPSPEQVILVYDVGVSVDVGQLCYKTVELRVRRRGKGIRVDLTSHMGVRTLLVQKLIQHLSRRFSREEFRPLTEYTHAKRVIEFIRWCWDGHHKELIVSKAGTELALEAYAAHLREKVRGGELSPNTTGPMQSHAHTFCKEYHRDANLARHLRTVDKGKRFSVPTEIPNEESIARVLALCGSIFTGLSSLVINFAPFPHAVKMPTYLVLQQDNLWYFPGKKPFITAADRDKKHRGLAPTKFRPIDFAEGRILDPQDIVNQYPQHRRKNTVDAKWDYRAANKSVAAAHASLLSANEDPNHVDRIEAGMKALNAFIILFAADTGMNESSIQNCPWSEEFQVSRSRPNFRVIKFRAAKEVSFELSTSLLSRFKKFIELREYLLNGNRCDTLFFTFGHDKSAGRQAKKLGQKCMYRAYDLLTRIDPNLTKVLTRQWRLNSIDFYIRKTDTATAASLLQNSEKTTKAHYANGSATVAALELTQFYASVKQKIRTQSDQGETTSTGWLAGCSSFGKPAADSDSFEPVFCNAPSGCLFCNKLVVHADEKDVRKILSYKFFVQSGRSLSMNSESFERNFGPALKRVEMIIEAVAAASSTTSAMVARVRYEVEEDQMLDSHFQHKLDQLVELGTLVHYSPLAAAK